MPGKNGSRKTRRRKPHAVIAPRKNAMLVRIASKERSLKNKKLPHGEREWVLASLGRGTGRPTARQGHLRPEFLDPPERRR
jgi:hypothetical protein